uniref:Putative ovule protein n=1 Tax=Solanum chacoense TaxID=4108 RepID=A0A0V0GZR1_SOLCH
MISPAAPTFGLICILGPRLLCNKHFHSISSTGAGSCKDESPVSLKYQILRAFLYHNMILLI